MILLTRAPIDVGAELSRFCAGRTETGAVASFVGLARGAAAGAPALELDVYPGFTEARLRSLAESAVGRFGLDDARVVHRYGAIAVGEPIVLVLTAARHRRAAFDACDFLMDHLKSNAPIWKKEGDAWIEPTEADRESLKRWDAPPPSPLRGREEIDK